jgi:hypothetical protein
LTTVAEISESTVALPDRARGGRGRIPAYEVAQSRVTTAALTESVADVDARPRDRGQVHWANTMPDSNAQPGPTRAGPLIRIAFGSLRTRPRSLSRAALRAAVRPPRRVQPTAAVHGEEGPGHHGQYGPLRSGMATSLLTFPRSAVVQFGSYSAPDPGECSSTILGGLVGARKQSQSINGCLPKRHR